MGRQQWNTADIIVIREPDHFVAVGSELVFDRSEPPARPLHLHARQDSASSLPTGIPAPTSSNQSAASSTTSGPLSTDTPTQTTALPSPFDSTLGNNFTTQSCPNFFQSFLSNTTFQHCLPLSLLLQRQLTVDPQTSNGFFATAKSKVLLSQTLDVSCKANFTICAPLMASLAQQLQLPANCASDFAMQNPTVLQAYNGLIAYPPLYHAGCLTDTGGQYCVANAMTNASSPTSSYIYYLPLGLQLPNGTKPACNMCLQNTMAIFATAAGNSSVPLSGDYTSAAQQVDAGCGTQFAEASVENGSSSSLLGSRSLYGFLMMGFLVTWLLA
ncbi:hypothetical protein LTR91_003790 [Friedmanniomyces endolithicus]|uniref:DUF7729 domain-containing protein n=1 Tax=Friedmanniomyces endolithicus TaxID=329885 RepID=A0AAN6J015_9PEZI|nr:hypothetical protein LTS00_016489 [Friedmanniomyces endolithicus]KAK0305425.1 hypothetical protein LTR82_016795 [Friedmanniomyces endolithicus]KAK0975886.1 hypothetical protein LTR54_016663 [Friedmanniomyces endolithicus]KAK0986374.1 hypothetical protein LTS01_009899 [Friedmanniomyces endolithicus]KAK1005865.1 hypothetical protein LTR91_003790 [Friedmanniomyces endolithicus]